MQVDLYECNLRKKDPEHAEQIIAEQNKQAFLFVGGALTGGSGELFSLFMDGVAGYGFYQVGKGIVKNDAAQVKDGVTNMVIAASGDLVGSAASKVVGIATKTYYNFGSKALGEMGEEALAREHGTFKPSGKGSSLSTSIGVRKPDGIPVGTTVTSTDKLFEAKVGFQELSGNTATQVEKDAELLKSGQINEITWSFFRSPKTGKVGGSDELLQALKKAGIKTEILGDIPKDIVNKAIKTYAPTVKQ